LHEPLRENGANTAEKYPAAYHVVKYPAAFGECQFSIHGRLDLRVLLRRRLGLGIKEIRRAA